jgi:hypothetical protein
VNQAPRFRSDWPIPEEYLLELGRLCSVWATLEMQLNLFIGKLAGFNELNDMTPFILTAHASFPQRLDMLGALCEYLAPQYPTLKCHADTLAKLKAAQSARNRLIHNGIVAAEDAHGFVLVRGSARGKVKTDMNPVSPDDIRAATSQVNEAARALYKLVLGKDIPAAGREESERV